MGTLDQTLASDWDFAAEIATSAQRPDAWNEDASWSHDATLSKMPQTVMWQQANVAVRVALLQEQWEKWTVVLPYKDGAENKELIWK